ncbi:DUF2894 domain-containing protein [Dyella telluris]|nr:DUF2894 domain-containing protein [Dyella telluris]
MASVRAQLDAWREQGADRLDSIRFHLLDALATRAARHEGGARRLLDQRLADLMEAYASDVARSLKNGGGATANVVVSNGAPAPGPFGELIEQLARASEVRGEYTAVTSPSQTAALPEMELLGEFRRIWSSVRTESQLRQSMEQAPENAGPLNSRALVHRAIALMRDLSPGYLQHFLAYIDDLSSMERMNGSPATMARDAAPSAAPKKRSRAKAGSRRE